MIMIMQVRASSKLNSRSFLPASQIRVYYDTWEGVLTQCNAITSKTPLGAGFQQADASSGRENK